MVCRVCLKIPRCCTYEHQCCVVLFSVFAPSVDWCSGAHMFVLVDCITHICFHILWTFMVHVYLLQLVCADVFVSILYTSIF